uniref:CSON002769 protein n=1 Tax=Culicoides sonorensis TaxID=179676 RepID=A0A336MJV8_CULSO
MASKILKNNSKQNTFKKQTNDNSKPKKKDSYESSDEEDSIIPEVLNDVFKNVKTEFNALSIESLTNAFNFGAVCLICISKVKRIDPIWSCSNCYTFLHLNCIQRWANDSLAQKRIAQELAEGYYNNLGEYIPKKIKQLEWNCPKCRQCYPPEEIPRHYLCFCQKQYDPVDQEWILPHSCGELCMKKLDCNHSCLLLCHPGKCPPCPQVVTVSCECQISPPKTIRCFEKKWNCYKKCGKKLDCGHICESTCHEINKCPPCNKKRVQKCNCGNLSQERYCYEPPLRCNKICNRFYSCNAHKCEKLCCDGNCGSCIKGLVKTCPCGKQQSSGICTDMITSCGDTCGKVLSCGVHNCISRCHLGPCPDCLEIIEKPCRCGLFKKEVACSKEFTCETKCKKMRSCKKHPCSKKCCPDSEETLCEKNCGKTLSCGKHKCHSLCGHVGPCYPCNELSEVKCKCGATSKNIACGREKKAKPPKCRQPCNVKSKCHHANIHPCHFGPCPPCQEICKETLPCSHLCASKCHDNVKVHIKDPNFKPTVPGEVAIEKIVYKKLDHPQCESKVPVMCIGGHEISPWPCWNSKPSSCGRNCGRKLTCGNHNCEKACHSVINVESLEQDENCESCQRGCEKKRPEGCTHPCNKSCHPLSCKPCIAIIKRPCYCGLIQVQFKCSDFYNDIDNNQLMEQRKKLLTCGNRCPKNYACGHRCTSVCHEGNCPDPDSCKKKQKIYCKCQNRKIEISCDKIRSGFKLKCDESCEAKKKSIVSQREEQEKRRKELEEIENRKELEKYEQKFGKKVYKERRKQIIEDKNERNLMKYLIPIAGVSIVVISVLLYNL